MKIPFYKLATFWNLVIQSGQIALGAAQGITIAADAKHSWNYAIAAIQASLGIISLWTVDRDKNNIIDIAEGTITTTVIVTAPKSADVKIDKTTETKTDV